MSSRTGKVLKKFQIELPILTKVIASSNWSFDHQESEATVGFKDFVTRVDLVSGQTRIDRSGQARVERRKIDRRNGFAFFFAKSCLNLYWLKLRPMEVMDSKFFVKDDDFLPLTNLRVYQISSGKVHKKAADYSTKSLIGFGEIGLLKIEKAGFII